MAHVFVGLSGGVDSAVSAALLKAAGHDVVGAFIKIWQPEFFECTWKEDRLDAMRVCAALDIPFREIDLSDEYKETVIRDMIEGYKRGVTPNPDVLCNRRIKFGSFAKWAFDNGADKIATGHYARVEEKGGNYQLLRGLDTNKDQSYFLWQLTDRDLSKIMFPVGGLPKSEVRKHAEHFGLPVASKADSQGLCFVGNVTIPEFLALYISLEKGIVLDKKGMHIGIHDGAYLYTTGQRHGFKTVSNSNQSPYYVIASDVPSNTITVSTSRLDASRTKFLLHHVSWISQKQGLPINVVAQVRYREAPTAVFVTERGDDLHVEFTHPVLAAAGQSLVLYDGNRLLGGGIIARSW